MSANPTPTPIQEAVEATEIVKRVRMALNTGATSGGASANARHIFAEMRDELDKAIAPLTRLRTVETGGAKPDAWQHRVVENSFITERERQEAISVGAGSTNDAFTIPLYRHPPVARVWTAEEWKAAEIPAGAEFRTGNVDDNGGMLWSMFYTRKRILEAFVGYTHLYGPFDEQEGPDHIPQPPTPKQEGQG